jgi:hypothetical protein
MKPILRNERGFSLVAFMVLFVLLTLLMQAFWSADETMRRSQNRAQQVNDAQANRNLLDSYLRSDTACLYGAFNGKSFDPADANLQITDLVVNDIVANAPAPPPYVRGTKVYAQATMKVSPTLTMSSIGVKKESDMGGDKYLVNLQLTYTKADVTKTSMGATDLSQSIPLVLEIDPGAANAVIGCHSTSGATTGSVPAGAVMAFNLDACPTGWANFDNANGRMVIGSGTRNFVDPREQSDWAWWTTQMGIAVGVPPADITYNRGTLYGRLFQTEFKEQMAEHWHYVLNMLHVYPYLNPFTGAYTGWRLKNAPIAHSGRSVGGWAPAGGSFHSMPTAGWGGFPAATVSAIADLTGGAPGASVFSTGALVGGAIPACAPTGCHSADDEGLSGALMQMGAGAQPLGGPSVGYVPPGNIPGGTGDGNGNPPPGNPPADPPPWQPPPDPWGWVFYDGMYNSYYSFGTTSCTLKRTPCQPPGYPYFQGLMSEGGGTWSSRGNFVLPPTVALKYCVKL